MCPSLRGHDLCLTTFSSQPFVRRLLTRLISLIPSMIVAISSGGSGINALLIGSQVALSVVLPFVAFPLIYLTSSKMVMAVKTPKVMQEKLVDASPIPSHAVSDTLSVHEPPLPVTTCITVVERKLECDDDLIKHPSPQEYDIIDFSSGYLLTTFAYTIWTVILVANVYAIVMLFMGETG
jgi:metal iron transporter